MTKVIEINELNIFQRMSAITSDLKVIAKKLNVSTGKDKQGIDKSYKAVGEKDVLDAVKPLEQKYRVFSYPHDREIVDSKIIVTTNSYGDKQQQFIRIMVVFRFVNIDKPEEYIDVKSYGDGVDSQDKAPGKAMTYADKYALLKAYKAVTGIDTDYAPSEELKAMVDMPIITAEQIKIIREAYKGNEDKLINFLEKNNLDVINDMTYEKANGLIQTIKARQSKKDIVQQQDSLELGQEVSLKDLSE